MSAPILDTLKAMDTRLQETKSQHGNAHSKSKDANPEKKKASDLESVDRFDREKLFCGLIPGTLSIKELTLREQYDNKGLEMYLCFVFVLVLCNSLSLPFSFSALHLM